VALDSELGRGTKVSLFLPAEEEGMAPLTTTDQTVEPAPVTGRTVLVVEDDERVRRTSVMRLTELGYEVLQAESGAAALELLSEGRPVDLLFTDIVMPGGMNGRELAQQAQQLLPGLRVLFTSGFAHVAAVDDELLEEGSILLKKPYKTAELAGKIREVLEG
jgi:CheY-like chemotaxis protein